MTNLPLTILSQNPLKVTLGWTPPANVAGYRFFRDGQPVSSSWDATKSQVTFGLPDDKPHTFTVLAVTGLAQGSVTVNAPAPPPPPPPSPPPSSGVWWAGPQPPATSYAHLTPTREVATKADLVALLKAGGTLKPREVVFVKKSASGSGPVTFGIDLADYADVIFEDGWRWDATPTSWPGVWVSARKLRCYGGVVNSGDGGNVTQHNGGDGIKIANEGHPIDFRWWGFKVEAAAGQGIAAMCNNSQIVVDLQGEIANWGTKYKALDPHDYEKGTGIHGAYMGGGVVVKGTTKLSGRAILYCHDSGVGAAWSCGANMQDFEAWLSFKHLHRVTADRFSGNGFQMWGQNNANVTVKNLLVDDATLATFFESLSSGPVTIEYGRYRNILLSPAFQTSAHVTLRDFKAG